MPEPTEIVRCWKRDIGSNYADLKHGAGYCRDIAANAERNPFADKQDAADYAAAARMLDAEAERRAAMIAEALKAGLVH